MTTTITGQGREHGNRTFPLLIHPLPGEPFDSWLLAYAHRLGTPVGGLLSAMGLRHASFLVDHTTLLHPHEAALAARLTGLDEFRMHAMTLRPFDGHMVALESNRRAVTRSVWWGRGSGSRFCPRCLAERDGRWLLRWRLSWSFACTRHHGLLHDFCPRCGGVPRRKSLPASCETPPGLCVRSDASGVSCGADLREVPHRPLDPDDPILAAQRLLDTTIDAIENGRVDDLGTEPAQLCTDLRALGGWLMRQGQPEDFDAFGPEVAYAWNIARNRYSDHDIRPAQFPPVDAVLMGALAARTVGLLSGDIDAAVSEIRRLLRRSPHRPTVCPPGLSQQWRRISPHLRGLFLRAGDPDRGYVDRLRFKTCTPEARLPHDDGRLAKARATRIPQALWPGWTVRLLPARGFHADPFRAVMALSLLVPGDGRRPVTHTAAHLHPHISRTFVSSVLLNLHQLGHDSVFPALCELADNLDRHGSPIDYQRRREQITPDMLTARQWHQICRDTRSHPGLGQRFRHAQRYLVARLTGNDLSSPHNPLAFTSAEDRSAFAAFTTTLTTALRDALRQHAEQHLRDLGIDEPLDWEPPRDWAPSLQPPGQEPDDFAPERLRRLVNDVGLSLADAAARLDTHVEHLRLLMDRIDTTDIDSRPGVTKPAEAWERRQRARTVITRDYLHREHRDRGKTLEQISAQTGIQRHIISEIAAEVGYPLSPGRRRIVIDERWLREQYVTKRRSFPDIAHECGVSEMTVIRCAREHGIKARPSGISSHPHMITTLEPTLHLDIRQAVESGLHGWQRLHRFRTTMSFPTIDAAADHLGVDQATIVRQLQRLETDLSEALYHRATVAQPLRPTDRGTALLQALDTLEAQRHLATASTRGTKANAQLPQKTPSSPPVIYTGSHRKRAPE
jgi:hypothetical protein